MTPDQAAEQLTRFGGLVSQSFLEKDPEFFDWDVEHLREALDDGAQALWSEHEFKTVRLQDRRELLLSIERTADKLSSALDALNSLYATIEQLPRREAL